MRGCIVLAGKSKTGELSIFPSSIAVLSYCLHMLPKGQASAANAAGKSQVHIGDEVPGFVA